MDTEVLTRRESCRTGFAEVGARKGTSAGRRSCEIPLLDTYGTKHCATPSSKDVSRLRAFRKAWALLVWRAEAQSTRHWQKFEVVLSDYLSARRPAWASELESHFCGCAGAPDADTVHSPLNSCVPAHDTC